MTIRKMVPVLAAVLVAVMAVAPAVGQAKTPKQIKYPKLPDFQISKPEVYTLSNGMTVFLMEDHELPLIEVKMRIRTGSVYEPADKTGLAGIFGQVQREGGTKSMTGDEIDEYLALRAASVETGVGGDSGFASMNSLTDTFDEVFRVFADVVRNPVFAEDKIEVAKTQTNAAISRRNDDISGITGREFPRLIYGTDSPLGRLTEYETIAAISRDDLQAWHSKYYHPNNIYIGVVGDFDSKRMKEKIQATFGDWAQGEPFSEAPALYNKEMKAGRYFIEKEDVTQAYVRLGHLGMKAADTPDYYSVTVMNEVLGGGFAGRLFSNVRSKKGLAYSVFGGVGSSFVRDGVFQVGLSTKSETMAESVDALMEEIQGIIKNPPTPDEMDRAKESILNSFVFRYDSREKILDQLMLYRYYDMPDDFLDNYQDRIDAVTASQVAEVAEKYIHPDKLTMLVVGKSADFDKPVSSFGQVATLDITIPDPPSSEPEVVKTAATLAAGAELIGKVASKLANGVGQKLSSMKADYTIAVNMGGQQMSLGQEYEVMLPDKVRQTVKTPMGNQVVVLNGSSGFMEAGGQKRPLPPAMVEDEMKSLARDLMVLSDNAGNPELEAVAAGTDEVDGTPCEVVEVSFMGAESRLCVAADGTVVRQTYQGKHPMQQTPGMMTVVFSEYGEIDGRLIPHKQVMTFEGEPLATVTLNSMELNPELELAQFEASN